MSKKLYGVWAKSARAWSHFVFICFQLCDQQGPKYPNLSPMASDANTLDSIEVLGSRFYKTQLASLLNDFLLRLQKIFIVGFASAMYSLKLALVSVSVGSLF